MEVEPKQIAEAYWQYHRLSTGDRKDRVAAETSSEVLDEMWGIVHDGPVPAVLELIDELLAHESADTALVGAGPVEDLLNRQGIEDWDHELAQRCRTSEAWRAAVDGAIYPDRLIVPRLHPYLRQARPQPSNAPKPWPSKRGSGCEGRQPRRDRR